MDTFVDTSFFLALVLETDALHNRAIAWQQFLTGRFVTTEFVLIEVADHLSLPGLRDIAAAIFTLVRNDPQFSVIPVSTECLEAGYQLFVARPDKEWGLTDCISFRVMGDQAIHDALSHDRHFEQAGYAALLRRDPPSP
jgi:predicted nucleic acid-binding protein